MAAPSAPNVYIGGNHKWGSDGVAAITTTPSESVTKVTAIISQTSGGAAIETVETSTKTSSDQFADRWALSWPTEDITSSPYYVRVRSTNADGNGPFKEIAPYIYFPPTVAVTAPVNGSTLTSASVTVAWTASDPYGISAQRVTVLHGADVLLDESVSESATSYAVTSSVAFLDGESYTFRVTARNGNGMEASADSTCAFSFDAPAAASVTITDDGATATITVDDPHYSESGSTIAVDGSAIADSFTVYGNSTQDGTPTPSAPVAIESVQSTNLIDSTNIINAYFTAAGGIVANSGNRVIWMPCSPNTLYGVTKTMRSDGKDRFSIAYTTEQPANGVAVKGTVLVQGSDSSTYAGKRVQRSITTGDDAKYLVIWSGLATFDDSYSQVQVCNGFALYPYQAHGSIVLDSRGKNLSDTPMVGVYDQSSKRFAETGTTYATSTLFRADGAEQFTVSTDFTFGQALIYCWEDGGSYIGLNSSGSAGRKSATLTTLDGTALAAISIRNVDTSQDIDISDLTSYQVEKGSTATAYEPYSSTTTPIDLQGNSLRSLPDGTRDELRVGERKVLIKRCGETMQAVTDGVTGTVGVDVLSSTGQIANGVQVVYKLAAPQEIDLGAASDHPFIPDDGEMWVDGTTMDASLRPADYAGQPPISSVDIARVNPDGTWTLAQGVTEGQSAIDPLPPLGVEYRYALTSHAAGGGTKVAYAEHTVETRAWHLNFGDAAQEHVSYLYNPQATMTLTQGGESYHFADGGAGRGLPVFYPTTDRDMSGTLKFDTVLYGDSDILLDLCDRYPVAWLRDPFGHRWRAHVRPSVSHGVGQAWPVTISWDAVRFEEA